jgi:hypothetical protein
MSSQKKEDTKQIKNIKEETNNKIADQEQEQQKQQFKDTAYNVSDTT